MVSKELTHDDRSKGGKARAEALSPAQRKKIAQEAAEARWSVPKATHSGELRIGEMIIPCAVLEDGTRLLTQEGFLKAIGRSGKPAKGRGSEVEKVAPFLALNNLKPFIDDDLERSTFPVIFQPVKGGRAYGYNAELLPKVCEVYLRAREEGALLQSQVKFAKACEILVRSLAGVGIIALVDEATGYQEIRDKLALQALLDQYLTDEWAKWTKTFPDSFYRELFRLKRLPFPPVAGRKPSYIGHWTNDIVYSRLAPGILQELKKKNPRTESGGRARKHHQHLTREVGHPALKEHIQNVVFLMKGCTDWEDFKERLDRAKPPYQDGPSLPFPEFEQD